MTLKNRVHKLEIRHSEMGGHSGYGLSARARIDRILEFVELAAQRAGTLADFQTKKAELRARLAHHFAGE